MAGADAYQRSMDAGLTIPGALGYALAQGRTEALFEQIPVMALLRNIQIGNPAVKTLVENILKEGATEAATQMVQSFTDQA